MSEFVNESGKKLDNALDRVGETILPGEVEIEGTGYRRRLTDRRIEKYLDENFEKYVENFGLVRELELKILEKKTDHCEKELSKIAEFQSDVEAELEVLNRKLEKVQNEV